MKFQPDYANILKVLNNYEYVFEKVRREGTQFRAMAKGYGLGMGISIPDYMKEEGFMAMVDAAIVIRQDKKV